MTPEQALNEVAGALSIPALWLKNLINFESGGNPQAVNKYTGARGLIQFMPSTAKAMGFKDPLDLVTQYPDYVSQLRGPVYAYFQMPGNKPPYPTEQSLYMTVFYPAFRNVSPLTPFPKNVQEVNPGIVLVQDYINKVKRLSTIKKAGVSLLLIAGIAIAGYLVYDHLKTKGERDVWTEETDLPQIETI